VKIHFRFKFKGRESGISARSTTPQTPWRDQEFKLGQIRSVTEFNRHMHYYISDALPNFNTFRDIIFLAHAKAHIFEHLKDPCPEDSHSKPLALLFIQFYQVSGEIQRVCSKLW
jgi:hypothetical protein